MRKLVVSKHQIKPIMDILGMDDTVRDAGVFTDVKKLGERFFRQLLSLETVDVLLSPELEELMFNLTDEFCIYGLVEDVMKSHVEVYRVIVLPTELILVGKPR